MGLLETLFWSRKLSLLETFVLDHGADLTTQRNLPAKLCAS
jgi:hypothetical protein